MHQAYIRIGSITRKLNDFPEKQAKIWKKYTIPFEKEIGKALRKNTRMYPEIAVRELVANALIHQYFTVKGFPMIEISNSGTPLVTPDRFIDGYISRNDKFKKEKIRACYQHACLKYVSNEKMTNQSLRERFKIENKNAAIASRIIRDALKAGVIKEDDPENKSRKYAGYLPFWA